MNDPLTEALTDRDRARTIAVHLEQENAELRAILADHADIWVRDNGFYRITGEHGPELVQWPSEARDV